MIESHWQPDGTAGARGQHRVGACSCGERTLKIAFVALFQVIATAGGALILGACDPLSDQELKDTAEGVTGEAITKVYKVKHDEYTGVIRYYARAQDGSTYKCQLKVVSGITSNQACMRT